MLDSFEGELAILRLAEANAFLSFITLTLELVTVLVELDDFN